MILSGVRKTAELPTSLLMKLLYCDEFCIVLQKSSEYEKTNDLACDTFVACCMFFKK